MILNIFPFIYVSVQKVQLVFLFNQIAFNINCAHMIKKSFYILKLSLHQLWTWFYSTLKKENITLSENNSQGK